MNALFVCSRNRLRSPTAEQIFSSCPGVETASAGTSPDAEHKVSADLVDWADIIFVMEARHRQKLNENFAAILKAKRLVVLGIRDKYKFMDPDLIRILRSKVLPHLDIRP